MAVKGLTDMERLFATIVLRQMQLYTRNRTKVPEVATQLYKSTTILSIDNPAHLLLRS